MKRSLLALCLISASIQAVHFQTSTSVTPIESSNESDARKYLVEIHITTMDQDSKPELIASPKIICQEGVPAHLKIGSADNTPDLLSIEALVSKDPASPCVRTTIEMKYNN